SLLLSIFTLFPYTTLFRSYDSISASFYVDFTQYETICDVGAGAGFPSIPLKICFPHLQVTIVDSLNKRITFLTHLAEQLQLDHRSEEHTSELQSRFDLVCR